MADSCVSMGHSAGSLSYSPLSNSRNGDSSVWLMMVEPLLAKITRRTPACRAASNTVYVPQTFRSM